MAGKTRIESKTFSLSQIKLQLSYYRCQGIRTNTLKLIFYSQTELPTSKYSWPTTVIYQTIFFNVGLRSLPHKFYFGFVNMDRLDNFRRPLCLVCFWCFPIAVESFKVKKRAKKQVNDFVINLPIPKTVTRVRNMNIKTILFIFERIQTRKKIARQTPTPDRVITWPAQRQRAKVKCKRTKIRIFFAFSRTRK